MIRRKKHLDKLILRYMLWKPLNLNKKLTLSFLKNFQTKPLDRLSFVLKNIYLNKHHRFYKSQNKLQCRFSFSFSVPSNKIRVSRFFLNKSADSLIFSGYQK